MPKGEQTRRSILDAAIGRFGRDGFRTTSIADVARDAAVGGTVTYAYFPNKEALFLAAVDEDAAGLFQEALSATLEQHQPGDQNWRRSLFFALLTTLDHHPLARRLFAGLEPEFTARVLDIAALAEIRKLHADQIRNEQNAGVLRADIDPDRMANGVLIMLLSFLMSVVQVGSDVAVAYADDVTAVFDAALRRPD
jgi:TetR/AcrR family transcriptional repressor of uid operon